VVLFKEGDEQSLREDRSTRKKKSRQVSFLIEGHKRLDIASYLILKTDSGQL